ncbi:MAG TPA: radical SAM protein [Syntrophales bacterium]|nr:radical SAM protein [Syntrophales bacterium]
MTPRILFILTPYHELDKGDAVFAGFVIPLLYNAAAVKNQGAQARIVDMTAMGIDTKGLLDIIAAYRPDVVSVSCISYCRFPAIDLIKKIRASNPCLSIIGDGLHFAFTADDALEKVTDLDAAVTGLSDKVYRDLVETIRSGNDIENIPGLLTRSSRLQQVLSKKDLAMDGSPPDHELVSEGRYANRLMLSDIPAHVIKGSFGCPFNCVFCCWAPCTFRTRDVESIVDEMEYIRKTKGISAFAIFDATFTAIPKRITEFCSMVLRRDMKISWSCESRVDIDSSILSLMREAGCFSLSFGVESGSPRVLKAIDKKIMPEQVVEFSKACDKEGIKTSGLFMYSLPDETRADLDMTITLIKEVLKYSQSVAANLTVIYPGTQLEKIAKARGIISHDFSWNTPYYCEESKKLGIYPEMPVYRERFSLHELEMIRSEMGTFWLFTDDQFSIKKASSLFLKELMKDGISYDFIKKTATALKVFMQNWRTIYGKKI